MNGIQIILLIGVIFIGFYFLVRLRRKVLDIFTLSVMICCALILIIWPDSSNFIADKLGVGRGADLVFYISILIFWFVILKLYARLRNLERDFTRFVRENALNNARESVGEEPNVKQE